MPTIVFLSEDDLVVAQRLVLSHTSFIAKQLLNRVTFRAETPPNEVSLVMIYR
jgi:hypothetical protein